MTLSMFTYPCKITSLADVLLLLPSLQLFRPHLTTFSGRRIKGTILYSQNYSRYKETHMAVCGSRASLDRRSDQQLLGRRAKGVFAKDY